VGREVDGDEDGPRFIHASALPGARTRGGWDEGPTGSGIARPRGLPHFAGSPQPTPRPLEFDGENGEADRNHDEGGARQDEKSRPAEQGRAPDDGDDESTHAAKTAGEDTVHDRQSLGSRGKTSRPVASVPEARGPTSRPARATQGRSCRPPSTHPDHENDHGNDAGENHGEQTLCDLLPRRRNPFIVDVVTRDCSSHAPNLLGRSRPENGFRKRRATG